MKNRVKSIAILMILLIIFYIFGIYGLNANCIFKSITNINCPACGLTRAFRSMLKLDFVNAIKFNILSIPLAILIVISIILLIYDILSGKDIFVSYIYKFLGQYYIIIIISLVISFLYNNFV